MKTRPNEVRGWDEEELLGLAAACALEAEDFEARTKSRPSASAGPRPGGDGTRVTVTNYTFPKAQR